MAAVGMAFSQMKARFKDLTQKYGKVALGVHLGVSAVSITGLYVAINNNVDVSTVLSKIGLLSSEDSKQAEESSDTSKNENKKTQFLAGGGGVLALALLCNKALLPVRIPITIVLTPPIARFLARRKLYKNV